MKFKFAISMILILSLCAMAQTQQPKEAQEKPKDEKAEEKKQPPPPPARPQPPPEYTAYSQANRISDPQKRIEALEKVLVDFPKADPFVTGMVHQAILSSMVKAWPDQKEKILAQAQKYIDLYPEPNQSGASSPMPAGGSQPNRGSAYNTVASTLLGAGVLLDEAKVFAEKGLASLDEKSYIETQKKMYESAKRPAPTDEELAKTFRGMRAGYTSVLGRILLKKGNVAEAEKLLKDSYEANPSNTATATALATIAEKAGNNKAAVDYLAIAILSGRASKDDRAKFEELYGKTHNNSTTGLEAFLDERYKKAFPAPVHAEHYKPSASRSNRVVLAEVFTGSGCPPCVAADLAFDAMMERYSRNEVAVIMYHQHIPLPDPMTNTAVQNRFKFYQGGGVPTYVIDGMKDGGGGPREMTRQFYDRINPKIEKQLEAASDADLKLEASFDGTTIKVKAMVANVKAEGEVKLQIALAEEMLRYTGENGVRFHPMVVRALGGKDAGGFLVDTSKLASIEETFDVPKIVEGLKAHLDDFETKRNSANPDSTNKFAFSEKKHQIDAANLSVIAFVQDEKTKKVLQAVYVRVKPDTAASR